MWVVRANGGIVTNCYANESGTAQRLMDSDRSDKCGGYQSIFHPASEGPSTLTHNILYCCSRKVTGAGKVTAAQKSVINNLAARVGTGHVNKSKPCRVLWPGPLSGVALDRWFSHSSDGFRIGTVYYNTHGFQSVFHI